MMSTLGSWTVGLVVNPVAGLGGPAGLSGSDGEGIQAEAIRRGSLPRSADRVGRMLRELSRREVPIRLVVPAGPMGEDAARRAGWIPDIVIAAPATATTAADTTAVAAALLESNVNVIVFAGGDGTARDVMDGIGPDTVVLGIPAGVKMHSGVFARSPEAAAGILADAVRGSGRTSVAEVVDIDEDARRRGILGSRLFGRVNVLGSSKQMQGGKIGSQAAPREVLGGIAFEVGQRLDPKAMVLLGPGTTVAAVALSWGLKSTLLGIDVVHDGKVISTNCSASELRSVTSGYPLQAIVSPIGGQGFLLGRGNQQLDETLLTRLTGERLIVVCTPEKLGSLGGGPFWIDTPDPELSLALAGPRRVIIGRRQEAVIHLKNA
ncbi:ATP-NAD kinase family protein [Paeniglutamicibacter quisquiliarum]|uniref:ATP-NAD kinase family protein n=1 Tax=Paeniglutamicibacter quisquiliarum TaxID=2849498 RepID=UPI00300CB9DD